MAPATVHLPNGQTLTVTPIFGGIGFKSNDLQTHHNIMPPGWTIILNSEDDEEDHLPAAVVTHPEPSVANAAQHALPEGMPKRQHHIHRFRKPSLRNDHLFISMVSNPNSNEFKPASSPTRQIAMMLWATLWWYFHQPEPAPQLHNPASAKTPEDGKPRGEWIININREGIFKGKHLLPKLERMGLIASEDSSVGLDPEDGVTNTGEGWTRMFVSRKSFWQMDPRIYLFTLSPTQANSQFPTVSPGSSRPGSPSRQPQNPATSSREDQRSGLSTPPLGAQPPSLLSRNTTPPGPYASSSNLPTFYPPPPLQYTFTNNVRHPIRPKPMRQGETIYTRYIPSLGQYLSFRVASLSRTPCVYRGPMSSNSTPLDVRFPRPGAGAPDSTITSVAGLNLKGNASPMDDTIYMSDVELLHKWMNDERVAYSWGENGPIEHQQQFLETAVTSQHSFPVIGCFDGKPFGFFEIYWCKEDRLSAHLGGEVSDWDRGLHALVGEQEFRGAHRVRVWLSALVHYCWLADLRTEHVFMEPRVDNTKYVIRCIRLRRLHLLTEFDRLLNYALDVGFHKAGEVTFPHKQSNLLKISRENWEAPAL